MEEVALSLAANVAMLLVGVAVFLAIVWFLLPYVATQPCPSCGVRQPRNAARCEVCRGAMPGPAAAHPGGEPYGFPEARPAPKREPRIEEGVAFNRGITRRVVTLATLCMGLGIGLRLAGMAGALGLPQIPAAIDGALTVIGGIVAFIGFVFLDAA